MTKEKKKIRVINNFEINDKDGYVLISINPKIYSLEVVYSAAYSLLEKAYIIIGGEPNEEILIEMRPKKGGMDLEKLGREFNNELINYAVYMMQSERNKIEKEMLMKRALQTNIQSSTKQENISDIIGKPPVDDPENIAKPWKEDESQC